MGSVYRRPPGQRPGGDSSALWWWGLLASALLGLWLTLPAWGSRPPAGDDVMAHLVRAEFGLDEIFGRGRLDGWFPRFMVGHQEFQFYGPGFTWAVGAVQLATFGLVSTTGALKVVVIASVVAIGPAVGFLARSAGLSRRAAGLAAVLALAVNNPFGIGLAGVFTIGLYPHQLAGPLFCVALGAALRVVDDPRSRWPALLAASLAGVVVTHLITALILTILLALFLVVRVATRGLQRPALASLAASGLGAMALSAFWLVPFLAHRTERGPVTTWATEPIGARLSAIFDGRMLFAPNVAWLVLAGLVFALARAERSRPWALAAAVAGPAFLVLAHASYSGWRGNEVTLQLANRGLGYAGLIALLPVAALLAWTSRRAGDETGWTWAADAAALAVAVVVVVVPGDARSVVRQLPEPAPELVAAARALAELVPDGARFATERDFPNEIARSGISHPDLWLAHASGRNTVNIFNLESSPAPNAGLQSERIGDVPPLESARSLARMGVTHLVTLDPVTPAGLVASGSFLPVWDRDFVQILEVVPPAGQPDPASLASTPDGAPLVAELISYAPERVALTVDVPAPTWVTLGVGWSPKWQATAGGRRLPVRRAADGLVEVQVAPGRDQVELRFRRDRWDWAGGAVSGLALLGAAGWALAARRRYESSRMSSSFSRTA